MDEANEVKELLGIMVEKHIDFLNQYLDQNPNCDTYSKINDIRLLFIGKLDPLLFGNSEKSPVQIIKDAEESVLRLILIAETDAIRAKQIERLTNGETITILDSDEEEDSTICIDDDNNKASSPSSVRSISPILYEKFEHKKKSLKINIKWSTPKRMFEDDLPLPFSVCQCGKKIEQINSISTNVNKPKTVPKVNKTLNRDPRTNSNNEKASYTSSESNTSQLHPTSFCKPFQQQPPTPPIPVQVTLPTSTFHEILPDFQKSEQIPLLMNSSFPQPGQHFQRPKHRRWDNPNPLPPSHKINSINKNPPAIEVTAKPTSSPTKMTTAEQINKFKNIWYHQPTTSNSRNIMKNASHDLENSSFYSNSTCTTSSITSLSITSPSITSPSITSLSITSPSITSPSITSPSITSPSITSPSSSTMSDSISESSGFKSSFARNIVETESPKPSKKNMNTYKLKSHHLIPASSYAPKKQQPKVISAPEKVLTAKQRIERDVLKSVNEKIAVGKVKEKIYQKSYLEESTAKCLVKKLQKVPEYVNYKPPAKNHELNSPNEIPDPSVLDNLDKELVAIHSDIIDSTSLEVVLDDSENPVARRDLNKNEMDAISSIVQCFTRNKQKKIEENNQSLKRLPKESVEIFEKVQKAQIFTKTAELKDTSETRNISSTHGNSCPVSPNKITDTTMKIIKETTAIAENVQKTNTVPRFSDVEELFEIIDDDFWNWLKSDLTSRSSNSTNLDPVVIVSNIIINDNNNGIASIINEKEQDSSSTESLIDPESLLMPLENVKVLGKKVKRPTCDSPEKECSPKRTRQRTREESILLESLVTSIKQEPMETPGEKNNRLFNESLDGIFGTKPMQEDWRRTNVDNYMSDPSSDEELDTVTFTGLMNMSPTVENSSADYNIQDLPVPSQESEILENQKELMPKLKGRTILNLYNDPNNNTKLEANKSLRPWITTEIDPDALKSIYTCRKMLEPSVLDRIFKCMASICSFSTSKLNEIEVHITDHFKIAGSMQCAYCSFETDDAIELTIHFAAVHQDDVFQCSHCFYRSSSASHQYQHLQKYHQDKDQKYIYLKNGDEIPTKEPIELCDIQRNRETFVSPMVCKVCLEKFYLMESFMEHIKIHGTKIICNECDGEFSADFEQHLMESHKVGYYQCIFCLFGCKEVSVMREHLADFHPSEFSYVCIRKPKEKIFKNEVIDPLFIESTVIEDIGIKKNMLNVEDSDEILPFESMEYKCDE